MFSVSTSQVFVVGAYCLTTCFILVCVRDMSLFGLTHMPNLGYPAAILCTGGPECDPKESMAFLQNQFCCPPVLKARRSEGPKGLSACVGPFRHYGIDGGDGGGAL